MNIRARRRKQPPSEVILSPLIDCVFLLLIFFLVTSMIKRFERQIPVTLSDDSSAITAEPNDDTSLLGIATSGELFAPESKNFFGVVQFGALSQPLSYLQDLLSRRGAGAPVTVLVERGTPFQRVINIQDRLELIGFKNVRFRIRDYPLDETSTSTRS